ncbi:MAG: DUF790 family protein [Promethearchaeota archaeon]
MFPKSLLSIEKNYKKGLIRPRYLKDYEKANQVLEIFKKNIGNKLRIIDKEIKKLEDSERDFKIIRALSEIIKKNCIFHKAVDLDPVKIRRALFEKGFVVDDRKRDLIINQVAQEFNVSAKDIEMAFFSDLPEEQILKKINIQNANDLIKQYNLSATQALLFNALKLRFTIDNNFKEVFRMIKYLGLMYEINDSVIIVSGPATILQKTTKYGTGLAKLIPYIISCSNWSIEAEIKIDSESNPRIFLFKLNSNDNIVFPQYNLNKSDFDSNVEERFYRQIKTHLNGWEIRREPTFVKAGKYVIIPDFGFFKNNISVYLEIVGFWTKDYIEKKIKKFQKLNTEIIVAVNKNLKCSEKDFKGNVIYYKKYVPIKPILDILKKKEKKLIKKELTKINSITFNEDIIDINKKAKELNICPETLKKLKTQGYYLIGKKLISKRFINNLRNEFKGKNSFSDVQKILDKYQLTTKVLDIIGYKIIWNGLTPVRIISRK